MKKQTSGSTPGLCNDGVLAHTAQRLDAGLGTLALMEQG